MAARSDAAVLLACSDRRFTPTSDCARCAGCWNVGAASVATPIRRERLRKLRTRSRSARWIPATEVPLLAPVLGIGPESGYQPADAERPQAVRPDRQRGARLSAGLRARTDRRLVLVEDMHWFDEDTVEVVQSLLDADLGGRLLVVMTAGRQLPPPTGRAEIFDLTPLSDAEADELILALHPEDERRCTGGAVQHRCDGIPLYIEEVVAKLKDSPLTSSPIRRGARHPV